MIIRRMITAPFSASKPWKPWYGYLVLIVVGVGLVLYVVQRIQGKPVVPVLVVPIVQQQDVVQPPSPASEVIENSEQEDSSKSAINDAAKAALEILHRSETEPTTP